MRTPQKRKKMPNQVSPCCLLITNWPIQTIIHSTFITVCISIALQLISTLSVFDLFGSLSYALTTLPTPAEHYLYGSKGNDSTCVAQGFFIQLGTIACFLSVSQAIFYHLTIVNNWSETKIRKTHLVYALYIVPIVIGLAFAFAGIPFYDNTVVWCNNSAKWVYMPISSVRFASRLMFDDQL